MEHEPTGQVTEKELKYGRRDVECTLALLNAMKLEYDGFPLQLSPENAMSAANITKAFLDEMHVLQPQRNFTCQPVLSANACKLTTEAAARFESDITAAR